MMFIWGEPLNIKDVADVFGIEKKEVYECCKDLMEEYEQEGRGIVIREVNKDFQFTTREENLLYIERLCTPVLHRKLSQSALETLAIVAYRQPVTKGENESIRGNRCDRVMEGLIRKGLVRDMGRSESVGRPILYGTTDEFLRQFGFETIKDLPDIKDIAHVWVNGQDCGIAWTEPYEVDITKALKKGKNKLEIEVVNTWHNALRGADQGKAPYDGIWTNAKYRTKGDDLLPAGLLADPVLKIRSKQ